ncbi:MAG: DUF5123 domain-containing protein [gamma proteobacterium symbiont of Bathyaustriella thionipta]|nr:DUF5123 domain-containing protein [gamma proteobacterium symbiont of Bathyaustriella thionipta]
MMKGNILLFAVFLLYATEAVCQTYYVANAPLGNNQNAGTALQPWRDIQFAVDRLNGGDTLVVTKGIYHETVVFLGEADSGGRGNPLTMMGEEGAVLDGTGLLPLGRQGLISIHDAHDIVIDHLQITNFRTAQGKELNDTPVGILIDGASAHVLLKNNRISHIENLSSCGQSSGCGTGANGISVYGDSPVSIVDLVFYRNEISYCILSASEAFTLNGNIDGFALIDNHVHDNNNIGFVFAGYESDTCELCSDEQNRARNGVVARNRSINNSTNLALGGFSNNPWYEGEAGSADGFYVDGGRNIIFDGNFSAYNDIGFEFASEHANKSSEDVLMVNNFVYLNREAGLSLGGYAQSDQGAGGGNSARIHVNNNSFFKNAGWGSEIVFSFRVRDATLANNIIYGEASVSDNFLSEANGQYENINWVNNLWWSEDTSDKSGVPGTAIILDPLFVDAQNGQLNLAENSPAIDLGIAQANINGWSDAFWERVADGNGGISAQGMTDINQGKRFAGQLDLGAAEFGSQPNSGRCPGY